LHRDVQFPEPSDSDGWLDDNSDRDYKTIKSIKRDTKWSGDILDVDCKICGSINAIVGIDFYEQDNPKDMVPKFIKCAVCGLDIEENDEYLAEKHFGIIPLKTVEEILDHMGEL